MQFKTNDVLFSLALINFAFSQFFVLIVEHADEPVFVDPTYPNKQTFIIYVGVEFIVDFYARPTSIDANRYLKDYIKREMSL